MATSSSKDAFERIFGDLDIATFASNIAASQKDVRGVLQAVADLSERLKAAGYPDEGLIEIAMGGLNISQVAIKCDITKDVVHRILRELLQHLHFVSLGNNRTLFQRRTKNTRVYELLDEVKNLVDKQAASSLPLTAPAPPITWKTSKAVKLDPRGTVVASPQLGAIEWPETDQALVQTLGDAFNRVVNAAPFNDQGTMIVSLQDMNTLERGLRLLGPSSDVQLNNLASQLAALQVPGRQDTTDTWYSGPNKENVDPNALPSGQEDATKKPPKGKAKRASKTRAPKSGPAYLDQLEKSPVRPPHLRVGLDGVAKPMLYGVTASEYNAGKKTTPPQHFLFDEFPAKIKQTTNTLATLAPRRVLGERTNTVPSPRGNNSQDPIDVDKESTNTSTNRNSPVIPHTALLPRLSNAPSSAAGFNAINAHTAAAGNPNPNTKKHSITPTPGQSPKRKRSKEEQPKLVRRAAGKPPVWTSYEGQELRKKWAAGSR